MGNLLLYTGITPNTNNNHYLFNNLNVYKSTLQPFLFKSVTLDNYRINSGVIKVKLDDVLTISNYKNVTYALNETDNVFYVVNSSIDQSGYIIYDCSVDYWATYIAQASINHINVLRCNRNIDDGVYDNIDNTINNVQTRFEMTEDDHVQGYPAYYKQQNVFIVFCLTYNVEQTIWGGTSVTGMFALNLKEIYNKYVADNPTQIYANPIDIAKAWVGGIYGVSATNGYGFATTNDAKITKAYLIPKDLIFCTVSDVVKVVTKSMYGDYGRNNPLDVYEVTHISLQKTFTININPNYNYYVGTINKGLKVIRNTSGETLIQYVSLVNNNDIQIIVKQGDNQQDITSEFEIDLTMNDGDVTNLTGIKQALKTSLGLISGVASQNYLMAGLSLAGGVVDMIGQHHYGKQQGNGDAIITFWSASNPNVGLGVLYPYGYTTCQSGNDEKVNARQNGAYFNCYVENLTDIFAYQFIGTGNTNDPTYVKANVCIDNIPQEAITTISNKLNMGVYLINL